MTKAKDKGDAIALAREKILKERGLKVGPISEMIADVEGLTTGNAILDYVTGVGGLPRGRLTELYGLPSSGKTTTALHTAAFAQKAGIVVAYFDYENALDPEYCGTLGLDVDASNFLLAQPDTLEQGVNAMIDLMRAGVGLILVDSVAQMMPERELSAEVGEASTLSMQRGRMMAEALRKIPPIAKQTDCAVVFTNHLREQINMGGGRPGVKVYTTPGGNALKYNASLRMEFKSIGNVSGDEKSVGGEKQRVTKAQKLQVFVSKNKVARPFRKAELRMTLGYGFSRGWSILQVLMGHGLVKKKTGGMYEFSYWPAPEAPDGSYSVRGEEMAVAAIEAHDEIFAALEARARELLAKSDPPVIDLGEDDDPFGNGDDEDLMES